MSDEIPDPDHAPNIAVDLSNAVGGGEDEGSEGLEHLLSPGDSPGE